MGTHLRPEAERRAAEWVAALGIHLDRRSTTVHARERGYKLGSDGGDTRSGKAAYGGMDDSARNAWFETHFDAIDLLVSRGLPWFVSATRR